MHFNSILLSIFIIYVNSYPLNKSHYFFIYSLCLRKPNNGGEFFFYCLKLVESEKK